MFPQIEATFTSSDLSKSNFYDLVDLVHSIPGLESARLNQENISRLCSPQGLAVELSVSECCDHLLCLYDIRELEQARQSWDFALYMSALVDKICQRSHNRDSVLRSASFDYISKYSYVLIPLIKGRSLKESSQKGNFLQTFFDFVHLSSMSVSLKKESRLSFVEAVRDKDMFFREFEIQFKRAKESFFQQRGLKGMPTFLKECKKNLLRSRDLKNTMQLSRYTQSGILRLQDNLLYLSKPLCLEYSIMDINLCDLLAVFEEEKDVIKSLLVHVYYNLQIPLQFFNLYALESFMQILQNWKLPYSNCEFKKIFDDLLKYKLRYRDFETCIPQWYQEPVVYPQAQIAASQSNVTFLYLWEYLKEIVL